MRSSLVFGQLRYGYLVWFMVIFEFWLEFGLCFRVRVTAVWEYKDGIAVLHVKVLLTSFETLI